MTAAGAPELGYLETYGTYRATKHGIGRAAWASIGLQLAPFSFYCRCSILGGMRHGNENEIK